MSTFTQGYGLLVGVGADLENTIDDAEGLHEFLTAPDRCGYPPEQVQLLTGETATRSHVLDGLDALAEAATEDSTVIVYFSGHGYQVKSSFGTFHYLLPFDYDLEDLQTTAISGAEFTQKLAAIPARKLLLLLDCCHAGGLDDLPAAKAPGLELSKAPLPPEAAQFLAAGQGREVIASCREGELSYAGRPYSAFTLALLEALAGQGAAESDGYVRVADIAGHTRQMVPLRTQERQHPIHNYTASDNFIVAYYAGGSKAPKGLPFRAEEIEIEPEPGAFRAMQAASNTGSGAIAQNGGVAAGAGGVAVGGNVEGGIDMGKRNVNTGGGAYIEGNVDVAGGDFVGRDKIDARIGNVGSNAQIAIGSQIEQTQSNQAGMPADELATLFAPLLQAIQQAPTANRQEALAAAEQLQAEVAKEEKASDEKVAGLVTDVANLAPGAVQALVGLFAPEALGRLAGGITRFVVGRLQTTGK